MEETLTALITAALAEDIGAGDITSRLIIPEGAKATALFVAREELVACGLNVPQLVYAELGGLQLKLLAKEGELLKKGASMVEISGDARILLTGERTVLNIMQRMSGVATLTRRYVDAVKGTKAVILDTRKTMPGLRALDKYAVTMGGGKNHRMRLDDMVLIKDNHIALCGGIAQAVEKARAGLDKKAVSRPLSPERASCDLQEQIAEAPVPVIVECDTLEQVKEALAAGPDRILLDNMTTDQLREAVRLSAGKIPLEASGGVNLDTVRIIAETGVDYISVGAITHSARAVDIGLDITLELKPQIKVNAALKPGLR